MQHGVQSPNWQWLKEPVSVKLNRRESTIHTWWYNGYLNNVKQLGKWLALDEMIPICRLMSYQTDDDHDVCLIQRSFLCNPPPYPKANKCCRCNNQRYVDEKEVVSLLRVADVHCLGSSVVLSTARADCWVWCRQNQNVDGDDSFNIKSMALGALSEEYKLIHRIYTNLSLLGYIHSIRCRSFDPSVCTATKENSWYLRH